MSLFQDEPDEDSSPNLFQSEKEERRSFLFQDEGEESCQRPNPAGSAPKSRSSRVLGEEPEETIRPSAVLFGDEGDEGSNSGDSAYLGDCEADCPRDQQELIAQQVALNFSTLNKFLSTQLGFHQAAPLEPSKKNDATTTRNVQRWR